MRRYKTLFEVVVLHNYYKTGYSEDFYIYPTDECKQYLINNKMVFHQTNSGFKVSYSTINENGTPLISLQEHKFQFVCGLKNVQDFFYKTKLVFDSVIPQAGNIVCFSNDPATTETLTSSIVHLVRPTEFTYTFPYLAEDILNDEASLQIFNVEDTGTVLQSFSGIKPDNLGYYRQKVVLSSINNTRYIFRISDTNNSTGDKIVHIDNTLYRKVFFGLVEINYKDSALGKYTLQLSRKESYWKFIIVNKTQLVDFTSEQLEVKDTTPAAEPPYNINTFTSTSQPDSETIVNGSETAVFTSDNLIPCYEVPKLNLQLKRVAPQPHAHNIELITHLPNPIVHGKVNEDNESEIYVFI